MALAAPGQTAPELVSFRSLVPEITETTYLTHALYYYPAKFIPQVVRYCLNEYSAEGSWVIDPFAGSATVGLEAVLNHRNAILFDLNPMLNHVVALKMQVKQMDLSETALEAHLSALRRSAEQYWPQWSNLKYWYAPKVLEVLTRYWGYQKQMRLDPYALMVEAALLKASKHFSYTEHKAPKLFKSKSKSAYMDALLASDWLKELDGLIQETAFEACKRVRQTADLLADNAAQVIAYGGIDSAGAQINELPETECLISSPPYLQAQEYIRTSKLDLYWLGHSEEDIQRLSRLEIPYRKADQIIETETLNTLRSRLTRADLLAKLDSYFCHTLKALSHAMASLRIGGKACIFVGNPKVDGLEVETWRIMMEYFSERGYAFERVFEDRIKSRQLFGHRKNKNPDGMKSEYLLVLTKYK